MKFPGNVGLRERLYFGDIDDSREPLIINNLLCYLTIHTRESEIRNIFEGFFIIAWQRSALSGCFSIYLCQRVSVTAGVYPFFFFVRF